MIETERVIEIYAEAYEAETGKPLTLDQLDNNEFEDFRIEYDSRSGRSMLTIFMDVIAVNIVKYDKDKCWRLV